MESQWKNIKPSKINAILLILGMLSFICVSHLVWSAYLTVEVEKVQNRSIDNQPNNFSENVRESLKSLQVSCQLFSGYFSKLHEVNQMWYKRSQLEFICLFSFALFQRFYKKQCHSKQKHQNRPFSITDNVV